MVTFSIKKRKTFFQCSSLLELLLLLPRQWRRRLHAHCRPLLQLVQLAWQQKSRRAGERALLFDHFLLYFIYHLKRSQTNLDLLLLLLQNPSRPLRLAATLAASFAAATATMASSKNGEEATASREGEQQQRRRQRSQQHQTSRRQLPFLAASPAEEAAATEREPGGVANEDGAAGTSFPARALMALSSAVAGVAFSSSSESSASKSKYEPTYREFPLPLDKLRCLRRPLSSRQKGGEGGGGDGDEEERRLRRIQRLSSRRRPVVLVACGSFNPPTIAHLRMFRVAEEALRRGKRKKEKEKERSEDDEDEEGDGEEVLGGFLSPTADAYAATPAASAPKARSFARAPAEARLALCRAAASADPRAPLAVDEWEARVGARRGAPVRTLRVLQAVEARLAAALREAEEKVSPPPSSSPPPPRLPAPRAVLLCGEDLLASMASPTGGWDRAQVEEIAREHGIVCVLREPSNGTRGPDLYLARSHPRAATLLSPGGALAHLAGFVTLVEDPADLRGVSSTLAREELRREGGEGEEEEEDGGGNGGAARGVVTGGSWLVPPAVAEEARRRGLYR